MRELGEVYYYVHDKIGVPLIVTDDDLSGTFTFLRALPDYGNTRELTSARIGQTWLNYLIEGRTILWWGGLGNSTEHTAFLRLKAGVKAPESGSIELNGQVVAEQIGAQIFIDGWAMVAPGDPMLAADFARRAGSVSHDGEAIHAAQVIAAMEAAAFVESDLQKLLDIGLSVIPESFLVYGMIQDIRAWHQQEPDWRKAGELIEWHYGYDRYGGNCHVIPNHALIILALLYGDDNFQKSLMIVNTSGWDTDCNSGNVGCLLGIKHGLRCLEDGPDWRGPLADRLYLPTADGCRAITDAVNEAYYVARIGYSLAGQPFTVPKEGARFHFSLPGSVQGFHLDHEADRAMLANVCHPSAAGERCLAIRYRQLSAELPLCVDSAPFIPRDAIEMQGYGVLASPTLYTGQVVTVLLCADRHNGKSVTCQLFIRIYGVQNSLETVWGPSCTLAALQEQCCLWQIPDTAGEPIAEVGIAFSAEQESSGCVYLDRLTWEGTPDVTFTRPQADGDMWHRAWINGLDQFKVSKGEGLRQVQNYVRGLIIQGTREWTDYSISAAVKLHMVKACGIAARVQGMCRYYALLITSGQRAQLVKELDGEQILEEAPITWELDRAYDLSLRVVGNRIQAFVDQQMVFDVRDENSPLESGAIGLICQEGRVDCDAVSVRPAN